MVLKFRAHNWIPRERAAGHALVRDVIATGLKAAGKENRRGRVVWKRDGAIALSLCVSLACLCVSAYVFIWRETSGLARRMICYRAQL